MQDLGQAAGILFSFAIGSILSGVIIGNNTVQLGRRYGVVLVLEGLFLAASAALLPYNQILAVPLAALACGIQNGMASNYRGMIIRTTHITGVVTDLGVLIGYWLRHRKIEGWRFGLLLLTIISFGLGGLVGAIISQAYGAYALWLAAFLAFTVGSIYYVWRHYLNMRSQQPAINFKKS